MLVVIWQCLSELQINEIPWYFIVQITGDIMANAGSVVLIETGDHNNFFR